MQSKQFALTRGWSPASVDATIRRYNLWPGYKGAIYTALMGVVAASRPERRDLEYVAKTIAAHSKVDEAHITHLLVTYAITTVIVVS